MDTNAVDRVELEIRSRDIEDYSSVASRYGRNLRLGGYHHACEGLG